MTTAAYRAGLGLGTDLPPTRETMVGVHRVARGRVPHTNPEGLDTVRGCVAARADAAGVRALVDRTLASRREWDAAGRP